MPLDWDNTPPVAIAINDDPTNAAPVAIAINDDPTNAAAVPIGAPAIPYINMPASFQPAFIELTGSGPCLDSLMATAADLNKVLQGTVNGELKSYQVRAGTDAAALPGIVRCANFNDPANAIVFVQL